MTKLLIVETIDNPFASEAKALQESLNVMIDALDQRIARHLEIICCKAFTKSKFKKVLETDCDFLHISAHGFPDKNENRKNKHKLQIGRKEQRRKTSDNGWDISPKDIEDFKVKASTVFVNACYAGYYDLFSAFFKDKRKGTYIGPARSPTFELALMTSLHFYMGAFLKNSIIKGIHNVEKDQSLGKHGTYHCFKLPNQL